LVTLPVFPAGAGLKRGSPTGLRAIDGTGAVPAEVAEATLGALNGLLYLLIGVWTRSAGGSFQKVVATQGSDIRHLMEALSSLNKMYGLIYTLIVIGLLLLLATVGLFIYAQVTR